MRNIFREILKELPERQNEIIADDPKDQKIADQMNAMLNWKKDKSYIDTMKH